MVSSIFISSVWAMNHSKTMHQWCKYYISLICRRKWIRNRCIFSLPRPPISWKTPPGYISLSLIQFGTVFITTIVLLPNTSFLVGSCWLFIGIAKDLTNDLAELNVDRNSINSQMVVRERFCSIMHEYSKLKQ